MRAIHTRLFSPWMTPPWLDLGYDTKLTYGLPDDADHRIEVRRQGAPATARPLVLPADGMLGERARRWRRLARAAVIAEQDPDRESLLPAAIGAGLSRSESCARCGPTGRRSRRPARASRGRSRPMQRGCAAWMANCN